ncbi:nitrous oxide-stimulated promoter family protein [bacterium]|nr:nitrous oxide-stimulated promoter family protein [bacterium]
MTVSIFKSTRLSLEYRTAGTMIGLYCRRIHKTGFGMCPDCEQILDYCRERLQNCPFKAKKPVCSACPVHCYRPDMRDKIRRIMRYAGPRMIWTHPVMTSVHLFHKISGAKFFLV